jgi:hypothetical protein
MKKVLIAILCFCTVNTYAQTEKDSLAMKYAATITVDELKSHLFEIAGDEYEGRNTGDEGQKKAARYIADEFASIGAKPVVNGSYFQEFPLRTERTVKASMMCGDATYSYYEDFYFFPGFEVEELSGDVVFAGYGIKTDEYNDYADIDVKGKILLVLDGEPMVNDTLSLITGQGRSEWSGDWRLKRDLAMEQGAKAMIMVNREYDKYIGRIKYWLDNPGMRLDIEREEKEEVLPTFFASLEVFEALLKEGKAKALDKLEQRTIKKESSQSTALKSSITIQVNREEKQFTSENVLCYIPGSDPELADEVVVVTAHYDHVGRDGDDIYNGADDDGSGTVTALEIAEAFMQAKKDGNGVKRSVLVMTVSGEEKGLLGSEWYVTHPVYPLEQTVANLNIDMIGRVDEAHADNERYVYLIGSDRLSTELHAISETANKTYANLELDYTYNDPKDPNRFYYRSDHYNFAKNNIPVIFYFSGVHEDYHQPTDTPDKIRFEKMSEIGKLIFHTAWDVANRTERIKVDVGQDAN